MKTHLGLVFAAALISTSAQASTVFDSFTSYFAFGDSLTDDGKLGFGPPPSLGGRFSNGIVYAEHIAEDFADDGKLTQNFALGGATAEADNDNIPSYPASALPFATFGAQVATFNAAFAGGLNALAGDAPLISVLFGANDLLQDLGASATVGQDAADAVKAGIQGLAAIDGRLTNFVIMTLPDLGQTPAFRGTATEGLATATAGAFNAQLSANAAMLRASGLNIIEFDLGAALTDIGDNAASFGITDTETPCTPSFTEFTPFDNCAFNPVTFEADLAAADSFFFSDAIHPNRIVHEEVANEFRAAVAAANAVAPVPLPSGVWLLLSGVGLLMLRRKAA